MHNPLPANILGSRGSGLDSPGAVSVSIIAAVGGRYVLNGIALCCKMALQSIVGFVKYYLQKRNSMTSSFTPAAPTNLALKLRSARIATGMSTRNVAQSLQPRFEISHATIANYEKGRSVPTLDVLAVLSNLYERPVNWFLESAVSLTEVRYRNLTSKVRVGDRHRFEAKAEHWLDAYVRLEAHLGEPLRPWIDVANWPIDEPRTSSRFASGREQDCLEAPIPSLVVLLQGIGVRTIELKTDYGSMGWPGCWQANMLSC